MRRRRDDNGNEPDESARPRKQRKQRPCLSCAECRRLKMKCNRQGKGLLPCTFVICPEARTVSQCHAPIVSGDIALNSALLPLVAQKAPKSAEQPEPRKNPRQPQLQCSQSILLPDVESAQPVNPTQQPLNHLHHIPSQANLSNDKEHNHRTIPAQALEPYTVQNPSPHVSASAPSDRMNESSYSINTGRSASCNSTRHSVGDDHQGGSYGTLMLSKRGRSKYLGPTAGSGWLKESEMQDVPDTPLMTRAPSPEQPQDSVPSQPSLLPSDTTSTGFPLTTSLARISTQDLLSCLPSRDEAWTLAESYYRYCAWHHDVAPKASFEETFDRVFKRAENVSPSLPINPQEIALVFIIMAQGTMFNIEMPNCDSSAENWLHHSERALVKGEFLSNNTVAGLQTLMGMHRDGDRWNLPQDVAEERRKVFWECHAADIFQAHCFSRPSAINPEHCDTAFPAEPPEPNGEKGYSILRFELSQISSEILNMAMKVRKPGYSAVTDLDLKLSEFEQSIPFSLRCRAALLAMPSRYPQLEAAIEASPEPSRTALVISLQQTNLALNVSETVINLHRPYYARALYDVDRVEHIYKPSFYAVIEHCAIIISIVTDIHARFPAVTTRQWNFWYHVFGSALCLGTLLLRDPGNVMASLVLTQIDAAINLFTSLLQQGANTPRYRSNLQWLLKLRTRALSKISEVSTLQRSNRQREASSGLHSNNGDESDHREEDEDVELLGWRTRLIERTGQGRRMTIRTIHFTETPTESPKVDTAQAPPHDNHLQGQLGTSNMEIPNAPIPVLNLDSTNDLLHDYWDPMLLQDVFGPLHDQTNPFMVNRTTWWDDMPGAS
ncbi:hypothetical protein QQS21_005223 [Conoideocrella luteorostrata]|uniref:Xylanolytic transcriptional activator regulatory domain-containing protein n=1 Tax=Conoideocrella luteorostrata TaxID=1105319 RepID=A0AAJ0FUQ0_9HYPO|nr:hypothetical protein QQS21_005223 [Conoideocrella luteorostrata]